MKINESHQIFFGDQGKESLSLDARREQLAAWIGQYIPSRRGKVLDIGCWNGDFLLMLPAAWDKWGLDFERHPDLPGEVHFQTANVEERFPVDANCFDLVFAGDKGLRNLLMRSAASAVMCRTAALCWRGDGPLLAWAQDYAARSGLRDKLAFPGFIKDMPHFWAALDFALFTGPREPFGLRIIEPQAAGTVVAGYRNGSGSDEIIIPGETGIMVPWGRQDDLAREMAPLWSDPARYAQIAGAARDRLQTHFSLRNMSTQSIELYAQLIR